MGFKDKFFGFMSELRDAAVEGWNEGWNGTSEKTQENTKPDVPDPSIPRVLKKEDFEVAGVYYCRENIKLLATMNPDWRKKSKSLVSESTPRRKIYKNSYINKPVKLIPEPTNKHDKHAIIVQIAGEKVGYIPSEENIHVGKILSNHDVKFISAFISGGEFKVVTADGIVDRGDYGININIRIGYV